MLAPGTPSDPIQVIDARDLAAWMLGLVEKKHLGIYNAVSAPRQFTMGQLIDTSLKVSGAKTQVTWIPAEFLEQQLGDGDAFPPWAPTTGAYAGASLTNVDRALNTGLKIRPLADTVRDTLAWHATRPEDRRAKLRAGLAPEKEAAVLAAWRDRQNGGRA
jgi:2'-hydroxyisoflavone reductase